LSKKRNDHLLGLLVSQEEALISNTEFIIEEFERGAVCVRHPAEIISNQCRL
jgi:hypothetical protein